ncbi:MAG: ferredoxin [Oligoflexia bacterium]|nr:ferredoxin [Oligoflexia bacterium]
MNTHVVKEEFIRKAALKEIAYKMLIAARTAPKAKGIDNLVLALVEGEKVEEISKHLKMLSEKYEIDTFARDAENILSASVMLLLGTKVHPLGLRKCGMCGFENCEKKNAFTNVPCVFNTGDLGIAIGSAVSVAMDHRVDNRIMYTVGQAIIDMNLLGEEVKVAYAIPLSATSKNPFFDRK